MTDTLKALYEYTAHVGQCEICREKQKQIDKMVREIQNHIGEGK